MANDEIGGGVNAPVPSAPTEGLPEGFLAPGQVLGDRYQIKSQLGRGGMGEVWRAFDLKLRVEVALKALLPDLFKDEKRRDLLRREVRAAREVVSPNVCRIFDLIEVDGRELVSMEYVDGGTLLSLLAERGPLDLKEAQDIASQFLAGLEAIHQAGLVHRDVKPENIMITRAGRVVLMDFGLARQEYSGAGTVSGTPAYMAPEQAAGLNVDARADVYSAGVVLAEMVSPGGIRDFESRQSVWEGIRHEPPKVPDSPWAPVLKKAVAKEPDQRYNSAHTLTRALEDVTLRVEGAEDLHPYPGLASFTEEDAEYFFGREAEVEQMWAKLEGPARLLAIAGPSGTGKTSFLRAGLAPHAKAGWTILRCTPEDAPFNALAGALASETAGDPESVKLLLHFHEPGVAVNLLERWRRNHDHGLLIVDQFEELFTLNPPEVQARFADLVIQLVLEADVVVLLSLRDDYLFRCYEHESLRPILTDLTMLGAPEGATLRRALTQPALQCGYRFEDEALVDEMLGEVEGERGALPLLAFAAARLWEKRDREDGLLTREAYHEIGGVAGALARHAEATIDAIGHEHLPIVRELLRNLVTAEGTRAVREWGELLSVFEETGRDAAEQVLRALINARLLTSYEIREEGREPTRRVEIIHESLLANWPRLLRWQTQDADAAQVRDQLRQAARTWEDHGRTDDMLWTGSAYREFASWRERYPGGLSELEEAFAAAMTSLASRRKRRRRLAVTAGFTILLAVLVIVGTLWRRSVLEARRAQAARLVAIGQLKLEDNPTEALAWAHASLGLADSLDGRVLALKALARGPVARYLDPDQETEGVVHDVVFSPDGQWAALKGYDRIKIEHRSGGPFVFVDVSPSFKGTVIQASFDASGKRLATWKTISDPVSAEIRTIGLPGFEEMNRFETPAFGDLGASWETGFETQRGFSFWARSGDATDVWRIRSADGSLQTSRVDNFDAVHFEPKGKWMVCVRGRTVFLHEADSPDREGREISRIDRDVVHIGTDPNLTWLAALDETESHVFVWDLKDSDAAPHRVLDLDGLTIRCLQIDDAGRQVAAAGIADDHAKVLVWDLAAPKGAEPIVCRIPGVRWLNGCSFDPSGRWITAGLVAMAPFWPLPSNRPLVFRNDGRVLGFLPDGNTIVTSGPDWIRLRALEDGGIDRHLPYSIPSLYPWGVHLDGERQIVVGSNDVSMLVAALDGSGLRTLDGFDNVVGFPFVAYDPGRQLVAGAPNIGSPEQKVIQVRHLDSGLVRILGPAEDAGEGFVGGYGPLFFLPDGRLLTSNMTGIRRWDLDSGDSTTVLPGPAAIVGVMPDGRRAVVARYANASAGPPVLLDLETSETEALPGWLPNAGLAALSPDGTVLATGNSEGLIQVGLLSGGEPFRLYEPRARIESLAFSADSSKLAAADLVGTVRIWDLPDLTSTPLHALPYDELMAKLETCTNYRAVRDEQFSTGWKLEVGPFPGWAEVPEW